MAISLEHKSITVDVNNRNAPNVVAIANVNDKAVRYLDVTLTASGNKLTFTGCTATATFATDGYLISDSVACTINSAADVITVPLENFKSMSGFLAIEIKIANGETQVLNTPLALKVKVTPSLLDKSMISKDSVGTAAEICREVATARGKSSSLNARLNEIDSAITNKAEKSTVSQLSARMQTAETSLTGKANATDVADALKAKEENANKVISKTDITDSRVNYPSIEYLDAYYYKANELYSSEEMDERLKNKANKSTTLAGYGISDTYTQEETNKKLARKLDSMPFDDEPKYNSPCYLTSGAVYKSIQGPKRYLIDLGLQIFESYPYDWMYAIKDIRVTDGSTIAIGYVKRTSTKNTIVLYLVENGALSTAKLYANVDSGITGYATYSNLNKTITMTVNWDEIPYNTDVQFGKNYVLCSAWCYGDTRLNYLLDKAKEEMNLNIVNKISSFVSTGKADKIVSNVQIVGMNHTDARLLISNFNRHYNGDDTDLLYIYTTDDTGATANLVKGVRVTEETGTATVDLSAIVSGAIMRFDYDFSGIADGTRLQGTDTGFLVKKNCYSFESVSKSDFENYEEKIPIDFGFFEKFAVVGDSYASGEIYVADSSQSKGYTVADYYPKSWGQILARKYGATCINLSVGGLTTRTWLTNSHGLTKMLAEKPQELYLCALGINDEISLGTSYLGTIEDIKNYDSYSDYPDTFYGNYGKIIEQIKAHAPKSKILLMSMAYLYNVTEDNFTAAIKNIADYYKIPFINIKDDAFYSKESIYKTGQSYNHPTAPLYAGMAQANERLFCQCTVSYYNYFKDFTGK